MTLTYILIFLAFSFFLGFVIRNRWRVWFLLGTSALAVYALQPTLPIRFLDFWLPTITLSLAVLGWIITTPSEERKWKKNWPTIVILAAIILILGSTRYLNVSLPIVASPPPQIFQVVFALLFIVLIVFIAGRCSQTNNVLITFFIVIIICVFIILKVPFLTQLASVGLRSLNRQSISSASALDLGWLGFSYIAFRLLHTLRDRQSGRLPVVSLAEYIIYVIYFPVLTAGPIDRIERFIQDLRSSHGDLSSNVVESGKRIVIGLFKKFVIADLLALISMNSTNTMQVHTTSWAWVLLYAFSFQIYLDFSGYTDIAIGLSLLMGIRLPENFNAPYQKPNLTQFWNNWHVTLTQWFRAYFFNPLTRTLRSMKRSYPVLVIIFLAQLSTMLLIGLWHGITWNFFLWGIWHGIGLFIHNRWSEFTRPYYANLPLLKQRILNVGGTFLTFQFVTLGWVFFALETPQISWQFILTLFNIS